MAENRPIDLTDAEEVTAPAGFAAGNHVDAMLSGMRARAEADAAARASADDDSHRAAQDALQSEFEKFLEAYKRALGTSISQSHYDAALADGTLEKVSNTVTVTGGIDGYAEFTAKNGGSKYYVTEEGVFHKDVDKSVSPEEAYNSAVLVSNLAKAHSEGVTISGNDQQKYMYFLGLQEANESLTPPLKLNNQAEILAIDPSIKAQAEQQFNAFKAQQAVEQPTDAPEQDDAEFIAEIDAALAELDLAEEEANAANAVFKSVRPEAEAARNLQEQDTNTDILEQSLRTLIEKDYPLVDEVTFNDSLDDSFPSGTLIGEPDSTNPNSLIIHCRPSELGALEQISEKLYSGEAVEPEASLDADDGALGALNGEDPANHTTNDVTPLSDDDRSAMIERVVEARRAIDPKIAKAQKFGTHYDVEQPDPERLQHKIAATVALNEDGKNYSPEERAAKIESLIDARQITSDPDVYNALKHHVIETGKASKTAIKAFLLDETNAKNGLTDGITKDNVDYAAKVMTSMLKNEDFTSVRALFGGKRETLTVNPVADFEMAAYGAAPDRYANHPIFKNYGKINDFGPNALEAKLPVLKLTEKQRVYTPEQGDFNAAAEGSPRLIDEAPDAGLLRTLDRMRPPQA
jgi:hypothetical protein